MTENSEVAPDYLLKQKHLCHCKVFRKGLHFSEIKQIKKIIKR